jgi:hypothetical protein
MISLNLLIEKNVKNIESRWRETVSPEVVVHGPSCSLISSPTISFSAAFSGCRPQLREWLPLVA